MFYSKEKNSKNHWMKLTLYVYMCNQQGITQNIHSTGASTVSNTGSSTYAGFVLKN